MTSFRLKVYIAEFFRQHRLENYFQCTVYPNSVFVVNIRERSTDCYKQFPVSSSTPYENIERSLKQAIKEISYEMYLMKVKSFDG